MSDPILNIHEFILGVAIIECLLLAFTRLLLPTKNLLAMNLLVTSLIFMSIHGLVTLLTWNPIFLELNVIPEPALVVFGETTHVIRGIFLYLYVKASIDSDFRLDKSLFAHCIPVAIFLLIVVFYWLNGEPYTRISMSPPRYLSKIIGLGYVISMAFCIFQYQKKLKNNYSSYSTIPTYWLSFICGGIALAWTWSLVITLSSVFLSGKITDIAGVLSNWIFFAVVNLLFIYTIVYTKHLTRLSFSNNKKEGDLPEQDVVNKVLSGVKNHNLHLEPGITVEEYASKLRLPAKSVTAVLNRIQKTNFYEFINKHRIDHAQRLLSSPEHAHTSILDIIFESGFNNKTSFHRNFNRLVGTPPSEYRKKELKRLRGAK